MFIVCPYKIISKRLIKNIYDGNGIDDGEVDKTITAEAVPVQTMGN